MTKKQIPNPDGPQVKIGDKVKITEGEFIGYIGEVVGFVQGFKNWIKYVKIAREDGKVTIVEVEATVGVELPSLITSTSSVIVMFSLYVPSRTTTVSPGVASSIAA